MSAATAKNSAAWNSREAGSHAMKTFFARLGGPSSSWRHTAAIHSAHLAAGALPRCHARLCHLAVEFTGKRGAKPSLANFSTRRRTPRPAGVLEDPARSASPGFIPAFAGTGRSLSARPARAVRSDGRGTPDGASPDSAVRYRQGADHIPAASSISSSRPPGPPLSRNFSAISPAFWRSAVSISFAVSGLSFKNCLAFSRPWPMRWEL